MSIPLSKLVRMPAGSATTYLMASRHEESYFLKKLSNYSNRAKAKVQHRSAIVVFEDDDTVQRMVTVKVIRPGRKLKRRGRKVSK